jgi:hypothetical protein
MGGIMKLLWNRLLPELRAAALPEEPKAQGALRARLAHLQLPVIYGAPKKLLAAKISGRVFQLEPNEAQIQAVSLDFAKGGDATLKLRRANGDQALAVGRDGWTACQPLKGIGRVATSGAWTAEDTYTVEAALCGTPYVLTDRYRFAGDTLLIERDANVSFGKDNLAPWHGKSP